MSVQLAEYFIDTLEFLEQLYDVEEFYLRVCNLRDLILENDSTYEEGYFVACFIQGLKPTIADYVLNCVPNTLSLAYEFASQKETELNNHSSSSVVVEYVASETPHTDNTVDDDKFSFTLDVASEEKEEYFPPMFDSVHIFQGTIRMRAFVVVAESHKAQTAMPLHSKFMEGPEKLGEATLSWDFFILGSSGWPPPVATLVSMNILAHKRLGDSLAALNIISGDNYSLSAHSWDSDVLTTGVAARVISSSVFTILSNAAIMVFQVSVDQQGFSGHSDHESVSLTPVESNFEPYLTLHSPLVITIPRGITIPRVADSYDDIRVHSDASNRDTDEGNLSTWNDCGYCFDPGILSRMSEYYFIKDHQGGAIISLHHGHLLTQWKEDATISYSEVSVRLPVHVLPNFYEQGIPSLAVLGTINREEDSKKQVYDKGVVGTTHKNGMSAAFTSARGVFAGALIQPLDVVQACTIYVEVFSWTLLQLSHDSYPSNAVMAQKLVVFPVRARVSNSAVISGITPDTMYLIRDKGGTSMATVATSVRLLYHGRVWNLLAYLEWAHRALNTYKVVMTVLLRQSMPVETYVIYSSVLLMGLALALVNEVRRCITCFDPGIQFFPGFSIQVAQNFVSIHIFTDLFYNGAFGEFTRVGLALLVSFCSKLNSCQGIFSIPTSLWVLGESTARNRIPVVLLCTKALHYMAWTYAKCGGMVGHNLMPACHPLFQFVGVHLITQFSLQHLPEYHQHIFSGFELLSEAGEFLAPILVTSFHIPNIQVAAESKSSNIVPAIFASVDSNIDIAWSPGPLCVGIANSGDTSLEGMSLPPSVPLCLQSSLSTDYGHFYLRRDKSCVLQLECLMILPKWNLFASVWCSWNMIARPTTWSANAGQFGVMRFDPGILVCYSDIHSMLTHSSPYCSEAISPVRPGSLLVQSCVFSVLVRHGVLNTTSFTADTWSTTYVPFGCEDEHIPTITDAAISVLYIKALTTVASLNAARTWIPVDVLITRRFIYTVWAYGILFKVSYNLLDLLLPQESLRQPHILGISWIYFTNILESDDFSVILELHRIQFLVMWPLFQVAEMIIWLQQQARLIDIQQMSDWVSTLLENVRLGCISIRLYFGRQRIPLFISATDWHSQSGQCCIYLMTYYMTFPRNFFRIHLLVIHSLSYLTLGPRKQIQF